MEIIGEEGLENAKLILVQNTSRDFAIIHEDEEGHVIDHSQSTAKMAVVDKKTNARFDLSTYCTCTESIIYVAIPATSTAAIPIGKKYEWDIMVETREGKVVRLAYGPAEVFDSYAFDEVE